MIRSIVRKFISRSAGGEEWRGVEKTGRKRRGKKARREGSFSTDIASPRKNLEGRFFTLNEAAKLILMNVKLPSFYVPSCRKEKEKLEPPLSRANSTPNDFLQADADFNRRFSPRFFALDPFFPTFFVR